MYTPNTFLEYVAIASLFVGFAVFIVVPLAYLAGLARIKSKMLGQNTFDLARARSVAVTAYVEAIRTIQQESEDAKEKTAKKDAGKQPILVMSEDTLTLSLTSTRSLTETKWGKAETAFYKNVVINADGSILYLREGIKAAVKVLFN